MIAGDEEKKKSKLFSFKTLPIVAVALGDPGKPAPFLVGRVAFYVHGSH